MDKYFKKIMSYFLALAIMLGSIGLSPYTVKAEEGTQKNIEVISKDLSEKMSNSDEFYDVMIFFKDEANLDEAISESKTFKGGESATLKERNAVIGALQEIATGSQEEILNYLDIEKSNGNVKSYDSFFIVNAINVIAKKRCDRKDFSERQCAGDKIKRKDISRCSDSGAGSQKTKTLSFGKRDRMELEIYRR